MNEGELHVWRVRLDALDVASLPAVTAGEAARGARFRSERDRERYLRSHRVLRAILSGLTSARLDFALNEKGKPLIPGAELSFSLSYSHDMALIGAACGVDVGVDVERIRPMPDCREIAERFFPPSESAALEDSPPEEREREFFRRWTRVEAMLKARGVGLYGAGVELGGEWTVHEVDAGEGFSAAAAAAREGMRLVIHDFAR